MSRSPHDRIDDIILCSEKVVRYTAGMTRDQFAAQELVMDAVTRNIEIIGEATKHLPESIRFQMPGIEWRKIAGMRDWLTHAYDRADPDIIWGVVEAKIPELVRALKAFKDRNPR